MRFVLIVALGLAFGPVVAQAQDAQTLADVRQELTVLNVEVQKLRRELSTTGGAGAPVASGSVLDRVNAMESELQRLTSKTEELENKVNRVVTDGTNRIGDLEFRLVELEGGDVGSTGRRRVATHCRSCGICTGNCANNVVRYSGTSDWRSIGF